MENMVLKKWQNPIPRNWMTWIVYTIPNWRFTPVQKNHLKHATYGWFVAVTSHPVAVFCMPSIFMINIVNNPLFFHVNIPIVMVNSQLMFVLNQSISNHFCWTVYLIMFELNKPIISPPCGVPNPHPSSHHPELFPTPTPSPQPCHSSLAPLPALPVLAMCVRKAKWDGKFPGPDAETCISEDPGRKNIYEDIILNS